MPKFDVVVGNPPFQSKTKQDNQANALWPRFFEMFINSCKPNGYVQIVVPTVWMGNNPNTVKSGRMTISQIRGKLLSNVTIENIVNTSAINKMFNVGTTVCYITIKNKKPINNQMLLTTDEGSMQVDQNIKFIPLKVNEQILNILNKTLLNSKEKIKVHSNTDPRFTTDTRRFEYMSFEKTKTHTYPSVNTSAQYTKGKYIWSSIPHPYQYKSKLIYSDSGYAKPFYDKGKYGLNSHAHAIFVENEKQANSLIFYFESKLIKYLETLIPTSGFASGITKIIDKLPSINLNKTYNSQKDIYEEFNLSKEEIEYIENHIK